MKRVLLAFALALLACRADAAWARVTSATLSNSAQPGAVATWNAGNLGAAVAANNRVICISMLADGLQTLTTSSVTDSLSNTYNKDLSVAFTDGGFHDEMAVWSTVSTAGTPSTITLHFSATTSSGTNSEVGAVCGAYSGLTTSTGAAALDVSKIASGTATTGDSGTTAGTTTAANELKLGLYGDDGASTVLTAGTVDTTYSAFVNRGSDTHAQMMIEDADSGASGSTARAEVTTTGTPFWGMAVAVYKLAAAAGCTIKPTLALLGVGNCGG